jgi:hypothetical protein
MVTKMSDLSKWMKKRAVAQKFRSLIEDMENGEIYGPLKDLMDKGKATVEITVDDVHVHWRRIQKRAKKKKVSGGKKNEGNTS